MTPMTFHQTYEVVTDDSAEQGEAEETGFDWQDEPHTFSELVHRLRRDYIGAVPQRGCSCITADGDREYVDGSTRNISLHPGNERAKRWLPKALKAAGLVH
ncbi:MULTISPECIES: hypothetical protein [Caballeronia]|nr:MULTISPECIES: hypothetical protein [Caballeronia]MCE4547844.1 hypothetical protein [Caballeronia sp. PC1]MCE4575602.1 hypothetical protein [Caballeronia sp. CLC5]